MSLPPLGAEGEFGPLLDLEGRRGHDPLVKREEMRRQWCGFRRGRHGTVSGDAISIWRFAEIKDFLCRCGPGPLMRWSYEHGPFLEVF